MEKHNEITYMSEGRIEMIELTDIEEILSNKPLTTEQPNPAQIDESQLLKVIYKAE